MTAKTKEVFKPEVVKAIADFIVTKKYDGDMTDDAARALLVAGHFFEDEAFSEHGKYAVLRDIPNDRIMGAMIRGYTVEKTPEDKLRDYYEALRRASYSSMYTAQAEAIENTLKILGIKIGGINA